MRLLLDTHVWLWMESEPSRLGRATRRLLEAGDNELLISMASCWEIAIKVGTGRLDLHQDPRVFIATSRAAHRLEIEQIELEDVLLAGSLPQHHRDPFDRMLAAQALNRGVPVLTVDRRLSAYGVAVIEA